MVADSSKNETSWLDTRISVRVLMIVFVVALAVLTIIGFAGTLVSEKSVAKPSITNGIDSSGLNREERVFVYEAREYLRTARALSIRLAQATASVATGDATIGEVREEVRYARLIETAARTKYRKVQVVPERFTSVNAKIVHCQQRFSAAYDELLDYWKDGDVAHLESGAATIERAVTIFKSAQTSLEETVEDAYPGP